MERLYFFTQLIFVSHYSYSEQQAAIITRQVLSAVAYMHKQQCLHKDVKVENVVFQTEDPNDWRIKLIDFGLARRYAKESDLYREKGGTLYTMSPEALSAGVYTAKVDVWSVGVVLYLLISGDRPFRGETPQEMVS